MDSDGHPLCPSFDPAALVAMVSRIDVRMAHAKLLNAYLQECYSKLRNLTDNVLTKTKTLQQKAIHISHGPSLSNIQNNSMM